MCEARPDERQAGYRLLLCCLMQFNVCARLATESSTIKPTSLLRAGASPAVDLFPKQMCILSEVSRSPLSFKRLKCHLCLCVQNQRAHRDTKLVRGMWGSGSHPKTSSVPNVDTKKSPNESGRIHPADHPNLSPAGLVSAPRPDLELVVPSNAN